MGRNDSQRRRPDHRRCSVRGGLPHNANARLRRAYFAQASELAVRYRVSFERLIDHLWNARHANRRLLLRSVVYVEDLVHAIACVDGVGAAWSDLAERYERAMVRRCRHGQDEVEATVFVRRLLAELRRDAAGPAIEITSLRGYFGNRPLRNWLNDRLAAARVRGHWMFAAAHEQLNMSLAATGTGDDQPGPNDSANLDSLDQFSM